MMEPADQPILILGMHRSGTSYLARLMQAMGVFIGDDLVGPRKGNPRGHFEAVPLLEFHQKLIAARLTEGGRAFDDGMLAPEPLRSDYTATEREEAATLAAAMRQPGPWGWKEPRTCLFLDLWREVLPDAAAVMVYRHPLEVHQSLLRREHWDLALFPDQAMRAYAVYNRALIDWDGAGSFLFNANAGYADPEALAASIADGFGLRLQEALPTFHAGEFTGLAVSRQLHEAFRLVYPEPARVFDKLQERADIPYPWKERPDDDQWALLKETLEPLVRDLPPAGRGFLGPLVDWWTAGRDDRILALYRHLGEEIGERVRNVEEWNRQAAAIYEDNKRLAADYEKMGRDYAKQQEFLARQARMQEKIWNELTRTGKGWEEQRDHINRLIAEKKALAGEIRLLKGEPEHGG